MIVTKMMTWMMMRAMKKVRMRVTMMMRMSIWLTKMHLLCSTKLSHYHR